MRYMQWWGNIVKNDEGKYVYLKPFWLWKIIERKKSKLKTKKRTRKEVEQSLDDHMKWL